MDAATRQFVRIRAENICEYCRMRQDDDPFHRFHVEHIVARQHRGDDQGSNLALACHHCNEHKGPNLTGIDPVSSQVVRLFHPRNDLWLDHFSMQGATIVGMTPTGRATVSVLAMNAVDRLRIRQLLDRTR